MSEGRDEKKAERMARKAETKRAKEEASAETKRAKEEARAEKQAELEAARKLELERFGAEVARANFANKTITIRQRGYCLGRWHVLGELQLRTPDIHRGKWGRIQEEWRRARSRCGDDGGPQSPWV